MLGVQRGYHCAYSVHYHLVMPVKYRKKLLDEEVVRALREVAGQIAERDAVDTERLGCDVDHVHLLCGAHPKYAPGQLVRLFKSITARELFRRLPGLKRELWGGEFWTDGYYAGAGARTGGSATAVVLISYPAVSPQGS
ncbi:MAG TPA: IS200/IS605 family transposase [Verrucomicrobiae bacterium]|nr:IS200/IS605 family transposase [Verrucomicrobiae bacterium]